MRPSTQLAGHYRSRKVVLRREKSGARRSLLCRLCRGELYSSILSTDRRMAFSYCHVSGFAGAGAIRGADIGVRQRGASAPLRVPARGAPANNDDESNSKPLEVTLANVGGGARWQIYYATINLSTSDQACGDWLRITENDECALPSLDSRILARRCSRRSLTAPTRLQAYSALRRNRAPSPTRSVLPQSKRTSSCTSCRPSRLRRRAKPCARSMPTSGLWPTSCSSYLTSSLRFHVTA